jgi:hypothetical protein
MVEMARLTTALSPIVGPPSRLVLTGQRYPRFVLILIAMLAEVTLAPFTSEPVLKLKLFWNGTLIRSATGFCVFFQVRVAFALAAGWRGGLLGPEWAC